MSCLLTFILFLGLNLLVVNNSAAQIRPFVGQDTSQSDTNHSWRKAKNEFVEVYFPEGYELDAAKALYYTRAFAPVAGLSYGITKPKKFPLIIRPEMANPNGFVTWMPRRSEWYSHQSFTPFIGGLDFFQALAIHEYRHINQFDYSLQSTNQWIYTFFGELGIALMNGLSLPSWFMEGDAVWAETKYTKGGRGRSPRFSARLKALILSGQIPSYDELIGRSYKTRLPNHYVFGHHFVYRARYLFGDDFWTKVFSSITSFPLNPYRIYQKFREHSGIDWEDFVRDTFQELKLSWEAKGDRLPKIKKFQEGYKEIRYPLEDGGEVFYLKRNLNDYWSLYKYGEQKKIGELNLSPDLSKVDLHKGKLVYHQYFPDLRYNFKSFHDIFVFDLKTKEKKQVTKGVRAYHAQWLDDERILAVEKGKGGVFKLSLFNLQGKRLKEFKFQNSAVLEFSVESPNTIFLLMQDLIGRRTIAHYNFKSSKLTRLIPYTRNNFTNLRSSNSGLLFEGDYLGRVQVMLLKGKTLKVCTQVPIMAYTPSESEGYIWYASERENGQKLEKTRAKGCRHVDSRLVFSPNNFDSSLAKNDPSISSQLISENIYLDKKELKKVKDDIAKGEKFNESFTGAFPHSWSFIGGRGFKLETLGRSLLGTFSYGLELGLDSEESTPYTNILLSYNRFWPTFSLVGGYEERKSLTENSYQWTEKDLGFKTNLPLNWIRGFTSYQLNFGLNSGVIKVGDVEDAPLNGASNETLHYWGGEFSWSFSKQMTFQQIFPSWGFEANAFYRRVLSKRRESFNSNYSFFETNLFLPGIFNNHGIRLKGVREYQTPGIFNYQHETLASGPDGYSFSRGYFYRYVDSLKKGSLEYALPLLNSDFNIWGYHYIRRIILTGFYDYTDFKVLGLRDNFFSYGAELFFESTLFRRFPLIYGVRYGKKKEGDNFTDIIISTQTSF